MHYEVEMKFRVAGFSHVEALLAAQNCSLGPVLEQRDCYFAHPARDFGVTDEALRLRREGSANRLTYKGPRIDATTKTRRELELPLPPGEDYFRNFAEILEALGFRRFAEVQKQRRKACVPWEGVRVEVSLDDVRHVGTYVELELVADEGGVAEARRRLEHLAAAWDLVASERRSYLTLLLQGE